MYVTTLERVQDLERFHGRRGAINWSRPPILQQPFPANFHVSVPEVLIPPLLISEAASTYLGAPVSLSARNTMDDRRRSAKYPLLHKKWKID